MSLAQEKMAEQINTVSDYLKTVIPDKIPVEKYEWYYKKLRGIKQLMDGEPWDEIERWDEDVKLARSDDAFKEYYKLRMEADRLDKFIVRPPVTKRNQ